MGEAPCCCGDGGGGGGGGGENVDLLNCLGDVAVNAALGQIPVLGNAIGVLGIEINPFSRKDGIFSGDKPYINFGTPGLGTVASAVGGAGEYQSSQYASKGGNAQFNKYADLIDAGKAGKTVRKAFDSLSSLKRLTRSLPLIGNVLSLIDTAKKSYDCFNP